MAVVARGDSGLAKCLQPTCDLAALFRSQDIGQPIHLPGMRCEDLFDKPSPSCRQVDDTNAAILGAAGARH